MTHGYTDVRSIAPIQQTIVQEQRRTHARRTKKTLQRATSMQIVAIVPILLNTIVPEPWIAKLHARQDTKIAHSYGYDGILIESAIANAAAVIGAIAVMYPGNKCVPKILIAGIHTQRAPTKTMKTDIDCKYS